MKVLVCISNVPDTTTKVRFVDNDTRFDDTGVQWIINPWDELALTRALELKEGSGGAIVKVSIACVGQTTAEPTIRKALAIGADDAFRIDAAPGDAYFVASQLAALVKNEEYDLILCGIESSDYNTSAVGGMLSELLDRPSVSAVSGIEVDGEAIKVTREIDGGKETVNVSTPFVAIVQKGIAINPRIPSMRGIMMARQKKLNVVPLVDADTLTDVVGFSLPASKAACKMIDEENVLELVHLLKNEAKVI
ncbi:MAG: electron transfer flavoprotein subunit beta/FixA family protein [Bacteroidales bacterium]|nr:electron transfer flavoprotein subunit beta/FixA family protein [Bacteroidales bacterium]